MDARAWASAKELLADIVDLPLAEQRACVEQQCADPTLRRELLAMLESRAPLSEVVAGATVLTAGTRLGPYEIVGAIGAGGMGEVYRARDTRLGRDVAIKVLPLRTSTDPRAAARFTREARAVAALNHPHICAIYDVGEDAGRQYLVMELLDGESLHQRLVRGPLNVTTLLDYGIALTDALEAAHAGGVIHRDLKPSNINIAGRGDIKILDFGLAKQVASLHATQTRAEPLTERGSGVGTLAYMSPEQMRGEEIDARSDLFSLGAVLYEMATARPAFDGQTPGVVADAILNQQPALVTEVVPGLPASLAFVIDKALEKDRALRYPDASTLRMDLARVRNEIASLDRQPVKRRMLFGSHRTRLTRTAKVLMTLAPLGVVLAIGLGMWARASHRPSGAPAQFQVPRQADLAVGSFALSPDGQRLVYADATGPDDEQLFIRALNAIDSHPLPGTQGATSPFWSPDGKVIGFFAHETLRRVSAGGGPSQTVCPVSFPAGGTWNQDDVILFADRGGLYRVPAAGATPSAVAAVPGRRLLWPQFLPDGGRFLYFDTGAGDRGTERGIRAGSLDASRTNAVVASGFMGRYAAAGYLLYVEEGNLVARQFDSRTLQLSGEQRILVEGIGVDRATDLRSVSVAVSNDSSLVYSTDSPIAQLQWMDRSTARGVAVGDPEWYRSAELSPDGTRVALEILAAGGQGDIWIRDLVRGGTRPLTQTTQPFEYSPRWSPKGDYLAYSWTTLPDQAGIRRKRVDGPDLEETLAEQTAQLKFVDDWSPDERTILFHTFAALAGVVPASREAPLPAPVLPFPAAQRASYARYSPDGKWIAYVSDESQKDEVYLRNVGGGQLIPVSTDGGRFPSWRQDGRELFYVAPDGGLFAVTVTPVAGSVSLGPPERLFQLPLLRRGQSTAGWRSPYTTRDGKRFLVLAKPREGGSPLTWMLNWDSELKQKQK